LKIKRVVWKGNPFLLFQLYKPRHNSQRKQHNKPEQQFTISLRKRGHVEWNFGFETEAPSSSANSLTSFNKTLTARTKVRAGLIKLVLSKICS